MDLSGTNVVVTGGAGFVGSHLAERLVDQDATVTVFDDLSNGRESWVPDEARFVEGDLTDESVAADAIGQGTDLVCHFAAGKNVNAPNPREQFEENTAMTLNVLDRMVAVGAEKLVYTSSSTVYGEAPRPTPEDYPQSPISMYGTSKVAEEGLISTYVHAHDMQAWVYRFANIVGPRLQPGAVIVDFIQKLAEDPSTLEILGDGRQEKSYMHVDECVDAMLFGVAKAREDYNVFNLGTRTTTSVVRIADIVSDEMGLDPEYTFTGGDRGWTGDVPKMRLSVEKLGALGWEPAESSDEAVRRATAALVETYTDQPTD
jgi:UDP-glucose 4-epimerase